MMLLSIIVPCYNSQDYLARCLATLPLGDERVEIILVNDGSSDNTLNIMNDYKEKYHNVHVVDQVNKGHGGAINAGLKVVTGKYVKVVDSDDWLDKDALSTLLTEIETNTNDIDMYVCNYVYENRNRKHKHVVKFSKIMKPDVECTWDSIKTRYGIYLLMHAVVFRSECLKDANTVLPEHTFYVDNVFVFATFPKVQTIKYLNVDLYQYFIGRDDQSVNQEVMIRQIEQQIKVNLILAELYKDSKESLNKKLDKYMFHYLEVITMVTYTLLVLDNSETSKKLLIEFNNSLKNIDENISNRLSKTPIGRVMRLPKGLRNVTVKFGYKFSHSILGFN